MDVLEQNVAADYVAVDLDLEFVAGLRRDNHVVAAGAADSDNTTQVDRHFPVGYGLGDVERDRSIVKQLQPLPESVTR